MAGVYFEWESTLCPFYFSKGLVEQTSELLFLGAFFHGGGGQLFEWFPF